MTLYNALRARLSAARSFLVAEYHLARAKAALSVQLALDAFSSGMRRLALSSYVGYLIGVGVILAIAIPLRAVEAVLSFFEKTVDDLMGVWRSPADWRRFKELADE